MDDNEIVEMVKKLGYNVECTEDGFIDVIPNRSHMVDSDVVELLQKNGYKLLRAMYANGFYRNVVVFSKGD